MKEAVPVLLYSDGFWNGWNSVHASVVRTAPDGSFVARKAGAVKLSFEYEADETEEAGCEARVEQHFLCRRSSH